MATGHAHTPGRDSLPGGRHEADVGGVEVVSWWSAVSVEAVAAEVEEGIRGFGRGIGGAAVGVGDGVGGDVKRWSRRWHRW